LQPEKEPYRYTGQLQILTFIWEFSIFKASGLPTNLKKKIKYAEIDFTSYHSFLRLRKVKKKSIWNYPILKKAQPSQYWPKQPRHLSSLHLPYSPAGQAHFNFQCWWFEPRISSKSWIRSTVPALKHSPRITYLSPLMSNEVTKTLWTEFECSRRKPSAILREFWSKC
jgi:hypothetical protein